MQLKRLALAFLLLAAGSADAQLFNISSVLKPGETVFDNSNQPWPFPTLVGAIAFDNGGSGIAYQSLSQNAACNSNGSSYRPDYIVGNFKASTLSPPNAAIPYQVCTSVGDWYQFTINNNQTGPFNITLYTVNQFAGATWTVSIDGNVVTTVTTPGNGTGFSTVLGATSGSFNMTQGNHLLRITAASGDPTDGFTGDFVQWQGGLAGSGAVACDFGPNTTLPTGIVGADLVAAFPNPHCILNADFTNTSLTPGGGGWVMSNPNTWLNQCAGTTAWGKMWLMFMQNFDATNGDAIGAAPCNRAVMTTDGGVSVLQMQFALSDFVKGAGGCCAGWKTGIGLYWPLCGDNCTNSRPALPTNTYSEITFKLVSGNSQAFSDIIVSLDESNVFDADPKIINDYYDDGWLEAVANNGTSDTDHDHYFNDNSQCSGKCTNTPFLTADMTHTHTYASLTTFNSATPAMSTCVYVDGAGMNSIFTGSFSGPWDGTYCGHISSVLTTNLLAPHDRRFYVGIGNFGRNNNTIVIEILKIRMFTCASYTGYGNDCTVAESGGSLVFH